ncbi:MAG: hypothetical protein QME75_00860 [Deltaproteobacteria bacterium]|nr:hypothetical protein [Deltaproteobacteria bacterium]
MGKAREFFSEVVIDNHPLASYQQGDLPIRDRWILKDYLEYIHIKKGLLAPYSSRYPLVEARELLPSFEKNFAEYPELPGFSLVALNRRLSYQQEIFQFDLLHSFAEGKKKARGNLDKILPHLDRELRPDFRQRFGQRDVTDLAYYEELLEFLLHMDRAQVIAKDEEGGFRLLGVYASFPSDLDTELKNFGNNLGKFKKQDNEIYEQERDFVYQFFMELYGFPIASERRTSAALFARRLSRQKEQYLIKVLGSSDRTITSLCGYEQKKYPLVEKVALISLPASIAEANPHLKDQGFYVDPDQAVVILKVTYLQHKYNPLNVLEDRALSVVEQEIIHPYHGGREAGLNILKDTKRFLKDLTDIVRGEYIGSISYKRQDLLTSTKTHEDRLKFLIAWLAKNHRRLATYSDESFEAAKKVLNSYLLNREYKDAFIRHPELHREALQQMVILNQAHQLQTLEKLNQKLADKRRLGPLPRISRALAFLEEKHDELPYFYPDLFDKFLSLWDQLMDYPYFRRLRSLPAPPSLPYRRRVWQKMILAQRLVNDLKEQHRELQEEVKKGRPFPVLTPGFPPLPAKSPAAPEASPGKNV